MYLAYISGQRWCGSGGCAAFILERDHSSFRVIQEFSLARLPITVLPNRTNGWHDLAMWVRGGGITSPYIAVLRYDGSKYPTNPSTAPALQSAENTGRELPLKENGDLLYP
jgi:hypothetical protein